MQGTYNKVIMGEGKVRHISPGALVLTPYPLTPLACVQRPADEAKEEDTSTTQEELHAELVRSLRERAVKSEREVVDFFCFNDVD